MHIQSPIEALKSRLYMHPAHLLIGPESQIKQQIINLLQTMLCINKGCGVCNICQQIIAKQNQSILWLTPEKGYTRKDLKPLFDTIIIQLKSQEHFFIILEKCDELNSSSANSILKILEDTPQGYHFILLTHTANAVLSTIRSRCLIYDFRLQESLIDHPLCQYFSQLSFSDSQISTIVEFLNKESINDQESMTILNNIILYWIKQIKMYTQKNNYDGLRKANQMLSIFEHAAAKSPMPGSSKIFWKNIIIQLIQCIE